MRHESNDGGPSIRVHPSNPPGEYIVYTRAYRGRSPEPIGRRVRHDRRDGLGDDRDGLDEDRVKVKAKMSRSQNASRYGRLAEEFAARKYGLELDHSEFDGTRLDAIDGDGQPWEIKSAMSNRKSSTSRFRLWEDQHDTLESNGGGYVFVYYKAVDDGIRVFNSRSVRASSITVRWGGSGEHYRDSNQSKIPATAIF